MSRLPESSLSMSQRKKALKMFDQIGVVFDWMKVGNKIYFVDCNLHESLRRNKPVFDLYYCATEAMNGTRVLKTIAYNKKTFKKRIENNERLTFEE